MPQAEVIKESGQAETFDRKKILRSILNSGVPSKEAEDIIERAVRELTPPLTTRKIFRAVKKNLRRFDTVCTMKYSLKQAIYDLGPTGYPFERYIAKVLEREGYRVGVGSFVEGKCVRHEVDVIARKDTHVYFVECKFHKRRKTTSDVKTALYVQARFQDIDSAHRANRAKFDRRGMLVTNTRFTSEAVKYADCMGLRMLGWKHPKGQSLEKMIEGGRTYPVTVLTSAGKAICQRLAEAGIVLASEVLDVDVKALARLAGVKRGTAEKIRKQAGQICA
jgi:Holliday junction resolvase